MKLGLKQRKWLEALRSGKFKQGKNVLCDNGKYCCLGVANEVLRLEEFHSEQLENVYEELKLWGPMGDFNDDGFEDEEVGFHKVAQHCSLADANDMGCSFEEIADFIEKYPEMVFSGSV